MTALSKRYLLPLTAMSIAMLSACASSPERPARAADPVVSTTTVEIKVCPAELQMLPIAAIADYAGPAIRVPPVYLDWISSHFRREALLDQRLSDARGQCPAEAAAQ